VGRGSRFHFEIALTADEPAPRGQGEARPYSVLVVDDHDGARANLSLIVEGFGWQPVSVGSGEEAVRAMMSAGGEGYDIVLMDWRMPGMDGLQAAANIRKEIGDGRQPVVIMVTAYEREQIERDARIDMVDAVLTKPATASTLFNSIMDALSRRGKVVPPPRRAEAVRRLAGFQILVVDDSEINREVAQRILEGEGATVDLASDGREAIERIAQNPGRFDAVLMDVQMPEMDGYEATRQIRSTPVMSALPIIALTAGVFKRQQEAALSAGMNAFVAKPFEVDELVSVICQMVPEGVRAWRKPLFARMAGDASADGENGEEVNPQALNVDKGLAYWNDETKYRRYLGQFARDYEGASQEVEAMLRQGEADKAAAYLHRMRGAAGSLMLPGIAAASAEIEATLEAGRDAAELLGELGQAMAWGLDGIARYLSGSPDAAAEPPAQQPPAAAMRDPSQALSAMMSALDTDDPSQIERALEALAGCVPRQWYAELERRIHEFDFRAAEAWILSYRGGGPAGS
jgi:CheY-like chemotaxis protein/HPt (histidine-containing phosphotransfer) domain-containing protein